MAGEIYIADKVTLDSVDTKVTTLQSRVNSTVADKTTLDSINTKVNTLQTRVNTTVADKTTLDSINAKVTSLAASSAKDYMKSADINKFTIGRGSSISVSSTTDVVSITGSGYLYAALVGVSTSSVNMTLAITVDDTTISFTSNQTPYSGILHPSQMYSGDRVGGLSISTPIGTTTNSVTLIPLPIRYERSLRVRLTPTSTAVTNYYVAYLRD